MARRSAITVWLAGCLLVYSGFFAPTQARGLDSFLSFFLSPFARIPVEPPPPGGDIVVNTLMDSLIDPTDEYTTFREAIYYAAADPLHNTIRFSVSGTLHTLAAFTLGNGDSIIAATASGPPTIRLDNLLTLGSNCYVCGLTLENTFMAGNDSWISNCYLGFTLEGQPRLDIGPNISITGARNKVGGTELNNACHFAQGAVQVSGTSAVGNRVSSNMFGFNLAGTEALSMARDLPIVVKEGAEGTLIDDNHLLGGIACVEVTGDTTHNTFVLGNVLGVNSSGYKSGNGVVLTEGTYGNTVGRDSGGTPNVIGNCKYDGVQITKDCHDNTVKGNHIGVDAEGNLIPGGLGPYGIDVQAGTVNTTIGSKTVGEGNWVAGHSQADIVVLGPMTTEAGADQVHILGNWVGTDKNGHGSPRDGINVSFATNLHVGDWILEDKDEPGNVVGGCANNGIVLSDCPEAVVQSNTVGMGPDRFTLVPVGQDGIFLYGCDGATVGINGGESMADIGPPSASAGNVIAGCQNGVRLWDCTNCEVKGNLIGSETVPGNGNRGAGVYLRGGKACGVGGSGSEINRIEFNNIGVQVRNSRQWFLAGNTILKSRIVGGQGGQGISVVGPASASHIGTNVVGQNQSHGILMDATNGAITDVTVGLQVKNRANRLVANAGYGLLLTGATASGNTIVGNWVGVTPGTGDAWISKPNSMGGICLAGGAHDNVIGSTDATKPNRICCNGGPGVLLDGGAHHNSILYNFLGRQALTNAVWGNATGLKIQAGSHDNSIGGTDRQIPTIIAANQGHGIVLTGAGTSGNTVDNCVIGASQTTVSSTSLAPDRNVDDGIRLSDGATDNVIGAPLAEGYSVLIAASGYAGVEMTGTQTRRNKVQRCRIGVDPTGKLGKTNGVSWGNDLGVYISGGQNNVIGGPDASYGNQISNNDVGIQITKGATLTYIAGNYIGTNFDGTKALGNRYTGVSIGYSNLNYVGSGTYKKENVISGNAREGVLITHADDNEVLKNYIGTNGVGDAAVPNGRAGVLIDWGSRNKVKGGNVISGNKGDGVVIYKSGVGGEMADNLVDGNVIGLTKSSLAFLSNGSSLQFGSNSGVVIKGFDITLDIPVRTQISNNWIFGTNCGVHLIGNGTDDALGAAGNRVTGCWIGMKAPNTPGTCLTGVLVEGCPAYLFSDEIAGAGSGVQCAGERGDVRMRSCNLHNNLIHVRFTDDAYGCLGDATSDKNYKQGGNLFGPSTLYAVDYRDGAWHTLLPTQLNDWGVTTTAGIKARIGWQSEDTEKAWVIFDPIIGGVHPTMREAVAPASGALAVTAMTAQQTGAGQSVSFTLSTEGAVTATVLNLAGVPVRTIVTDHVYSAGRQVLAWNGCSDHGTRLPAGRYLVRLQARAATGQQAEAMTVLMVP